MKLDKILVPVDFSNCSKNALRIAAEIAEKKNAEIEVINAIHMPSRADGNVMGANIIIPSILTDYEKRVDEDLNTLKTEIPALSRIKFKTKKIVSVFRDAVYTCLANDDIDLVVMGTKGLHGGMEKILGSSSADVISFSKVPVLMVPENTTSLFMDRIGFAADLEEIDDIKKLDTLKYFAELTGAKIHVFHIIKNDKDQLEQSANNLKIAEFLQGTDAVFHSESEGNITKSILYYIELYQLQMLVMLPRQHDLINRLLYGSATKKVAMNIHVPLLTIHE